MINVFVYGTLRTGERNWQYFLENNSEKVCDDVISGFVMYHLGGFPAIVPVDNVYSDNDVPENVRNFDEDAVTFVLSHKIIGEVFKVDENTLQRLDGLEGYSPEGNGLYNRMEVTTENGHKALVYFMNEPRNYGGIIESGDWLNT